MSLDTVLSKNKIKDKDRLTRSCCEGVSYIDTINKSLPSAYEITKLTFICKALSDPTRAKMLFALLDYEICVGEMSNLLGISQSHVSHQFRILRRYEIVDFTKDKKMSFYRIVNEEVKQILRATLQKIKED
ncbi:MAG: metalloregulator ArsR/SmtB family transcription factor [Campylobacteraceae bacterium]|nr:metalloregulator ArsR/SmtB family transcription factor [Campylobacteraceae bacterium]